MEYKKKRLVVGTILSIFIVAIMVSSATAVPVLNTNDSSEIKADNEVELETNDELEEEPTGIFFCILFVHVKGPIIKRGITLACTDWETGKTKMTVTGAFGHASFSGLKRGHTYKISAVDYNGYEDVTISKFIQSIDLYLSKI